MRGLHVFFPRRHCLSICLRHQAAGQQHATILTHLDLLISTEMSKENSYLSLARGNSDAQSPAGDDTSDEEYQHALEVHLPVQTMLCDLDTHIDAL